MNSKQSDRKDLSELLPLSLKLRTEISVMHTEVESSLRLRVSVCSIEAYSDCIEHFYRFYRPVEAVLDSFSEWPDAGIALSQRLQTSHLASDLEALGRVPLLIADMPIRYMPSLPFFAHVLGALYVLQGSTLGSQYILRDLRKAMGDEMSGIGAFFRGHGSQVPMLWSEFKTSLDGFGLEHPDEIDDVIAGAIATFMAVGEWMRP